MKVIIAGSRSFICDQVFYGAINVLCPYDITEVVSGGARGVDAMGERWAEINCYPLTKFPADWERHGKAAGPIRNKAMAEYADALFYIHYESSPGTADMIKQMKKLGKPTWGITIASTEIQNAVCRGDLSEEVCPRS